MTFFLIYIICLVLFIVFFIWALVRCRRKWIKEKMGYKKEKVILELEPFDDSEIDFNREEVQSSLLIEV